jgi:hypothetical protein
MKYVGVWAFLLTFLIGCSDEGGGFAGASKNKKQPAAVEESNGEDSGEEANAKPKKQKINSGLSDQDDDEDEEVDVAKPDGAITKGSFTVWTVPADPTVMQNYQIVIEVKLPQISGSYQRADLSGRVIGTDSYTQSLADGGGLGGLPSIFGNIGGDDFVHTGNKARLTVWVPGAAQLVQDTIQVRSEVLQEDQTITIVF